MAINAAGNIYIADSANNRIEQWTSVNEAVHNTKTIYYTAKTEAPIEACRNHPEWANLPCRTEPAAQPNNPLLPELPVTTIAYNMWDQAETTEELIGKTTRTKTTTFDAAGRPLTTEQTTNSPENKALPKVTDTYNPESGTLKTQSTTEGETTKTITSLYNTLGQLTSYTDADTNEAKYTYDLDGRVSELTDKSEEGHASQKYEYDTTTGELTHLTDSGAGNFSATYSPGGKMLTQSYPNGMTAYYTYNSAGTATQLEYKKLTHCTEKCTWFSDSITPSIHGETLTQTSTLSEDPKYTYDAAGRLTEVQEKPAGEGCKTRIYSYDEESNRTSLTSREPGTGGTCATEGGTPEHHTYDTANRPTDPGTTYDPLGNITSLPATDAGGNTLTSSYYADNQLAKQTQAATTIEYQLDPEDRTRETTSSATGKTISHYDAPGTAIAWTSEPEGKSTRNIPGIGGELTATKANSSAAILQLHDLQGNVVATAAVSETETRLLSKYNSSEFGVPTTTEAPPKYAWLGAAGITSELPSGTIAKDGAAYAPQIGRALQTQAIELPLPVNQLTPFTDAGPSWIAASDAAAAALEDAEYWEARRAQEAAATPPGELPGAEAAEEVEFVDPHASIKIGGSTAKRFASLLRSGAVGPIAGLLTKAAKLGGLEAEVIAEVVQIASDQLANGLGICGEVYEGIGKPGGKEFRCQLTFNYLQGGSVVLPENLQIATCFYDADKQGYDCGTVYTIGFELGLS